MLFASDAREIGRRTVVGPRLLHRNGEQQGRDEADRLRKMWGEQIYRKMRGKQSYEEMARALGCSAGAVRTPAATVGQRWGVDSRRQAVLKALRPGILHLDDA